jgi:hypothetical protein
MAVFGQVQRDIIGLDRVYKLPVLAGWRLRVELRQKKSTFHIGVGGNALISGHLLVVVSTLE